MMSAKIERAQNGYMFYGGVLSQPEIFLTLDELFERLLLYYEGRCDSFGGDLFGKVIVEREKGRGL
jgi:hypothetical protein